MVTEVAIGYGDHNELNGIWAGVRWGSQAIKVAEVDVDCEAILSRICSHYILRNFVVNNNWNNNQLIRITKGLRRPAGLASYRVHV